MLDFVCDIPGATASTAAWHAAIELGVTAVVLVAGSVFLVAGTVAFQRSARDDARRHPVAMTAPPDAAAGQPLAWRP